MAPFKEAPVCGAQPAHPHAAALFTSFQFSEIDRRSCTKNVQLLKPEVELCIIKIRNFRDWIRVESICGNGP